MKLYAQISKTEAQDDGTVKVWGYASTGSVDADGETVTSEAMKSALPDYMKWGAVREMHNTQKAAGTAIEASVGDDGRTYFGAHVVDSEAVKKVNAGVYKGFSIGGKVTSRDDVNKSIIKGIKLVEVSLVDRPANPEAIFTLIKADGELEDAPTRTPEEDVTELAAILDKGEVTPADVLALIKAAKEAPAKPAPVLDAEAKVKIAKGMSNVARLAGLLKETFWLVADQVNETEREGDGSQVAAALKDWLDAGGKILTDMVSEEVAELMGPEGADYDGPGIMLAETAMAIYQRKRAADVTKAGKALSASSMKHIQSIHDASAALGACAGTAKAEHAVDLAKARRDHADALIELRKDSGAAEGEAIDVAIKRLAARAAEVDPLAKQLSESVAEVARLKALPAAGKALLKVIGKGEDLGGGADPKEVQPIVKSDGSVDQVATLIKSIHAGR